MTTPSVLPPVSAVPPNQEGTPPVNADKPLSRPIQIILSLGTGAAIGYAMYWITRLVVKLGFVSQGEGATISPIPYVLAGVITQAIVETARLVYDAALAILGDRKEYENGAFPENATTLDRFRKHSWNVIGKIEDVQYKIDTVFSRIFNIRTGKEIRDQQIPDKDLRFVEIVRRAFGEEVFETFSTVVPREMSVYVVEAFGYTILGGHLALGLLGGLNFIAGLIGKIHGVYKKIENEEKEARKKEQKTDKPLDGGSLEGHNDQPKEPGSYLSH